MALFRYTILSLTIICCSSAYSQNWQKLPDPLIQSDTNSIYRWEANDGHHGAYGELVLLKSGRFTYDSKRALGFHEYTEGVYTFKRDTLILNSEFQPENLPIRIEYSDTATQDRRLSFLHNLDGVELWKARYLLNNDTSFAGTYYADFPISTYPKDFLTNIKALRVEVGPGITSQWMPIEKNKKFITVTVLSKRDFNQYQPKVLTNYKFFKFKNRLVDLKGVL